MHCINPTAGSTDKPHPLSQGRVGGEKLFFERACTRHSNIPRPQHQHVYKCIDNSMIILPYLHTRSYPNIIHVLMGRTKEDNPCNSQRTMPLTISTPTTHPRTTQKMQEDESDTGPSATKRRRRRRHVEACFAKAREVGR